MRRFLLLPVFTQKRVATAGLVVCLLASAGLSWQMHRQVAAAQIRLDIAQANAQAIAELVERYRALQGEDAAGAAAETDLSAIVTRSLQGKNFQPSRIQQQNGEIALRLDNAPFNAVLAWLLELEETGGVMLSSVGITQAQPAGVTLTLVVRGG